MLRNIIAGTAVAITMLQGGVEASGGAGIPVPAQYIPLDRDYSEHFAHLEELDVEGMGFRLSNGSEWQLVGDSVNGFFEGFQRWNEGDWIHFSPSITPYGWVLEVENRSLGDHRRFNVEMRMAPMPGMYSNLMVQDVQILPSSHVLLHISTGESWILPPEYAEVLMNWAPGHTVMLDVVQDFDFGSGVFIIRDMIFLVNISGGEEGGDLQAVRGIVFR